MSVMLYLWIAICLITPFLPGSTLTQNLFTYAPPLVLVVPIFLFGLGILFRVMFRGANRLDLINVLIGVLSVFMILGFQVPLPMSQPKGQTIRILTANVEFHNRDVPGMHEFIVDHSVDMVMMQEVKGGDKSPAAKLQREFPDWHLVTVGELAILSRWKLTDVESAPLRSIPGRYVLAATTGVDHPFRILTTHWSVPQISDGLDGLESTIKAQTIDYEDTVSILDRQKLPLVIGGDFNNPPRQALSRKMSDRLEDAFSSRGLGPGWTFPSDRSLVRIDHLFSSKTVHPIHAEVGPSFGSDHRSLFVEFVIE